MNEEYREILTRLKKARHNYEHSDHDEDGFDEAEQEYTRAWDAAGVIWTAAEKAEVTNNNVESARLWSLLAPYDEGAKDRMENMFVVLAAKYIGNKT